MSCPDCGAGLRAGACPSCGWKPAAASDEKPPARCSGCGIPFGLGQVCRRDPADDLELCPGCHVEQRLKPRASRPTDLCDCGEDRPHQVAAHIERFREYGLRIESRVVRL